MRMRNEVNFFKAYVAAIKLQGKDDIKGSNQNLETEERELLESIVDNLTLFVFFMFVCIVEFDSLFV